MSYFCRAHQTAELCKRLGYDMKGFIDDPDTCKPSNPTPRRKRDIVCEGCQPRMGASRAFEGVAFHSELFDQDEIIALWSRLDYPPNL